MALDEEGKLAYVRDLMGEKRYDEAKDILETMRHNPQAQQWLETIGHLAPAGHKEKREEIFADDDPYRQGEFLGDVAGSDLPQKQKNAPYLQPYGELKDYTSTAIITLILYWAFWPVGLVANIIYLREARRLEKEGTPVANKGCLSTLLFVQILPLMMMCGMVVYFVTAAQELVP